MEKITLSFTPDELCELAKQLYLGGYFLITHDYENKDMVDDINNRVCAAGFKYARETNYFIEESMSSQSFGVSLEIEQDCGPLLELYDGDFITVILPQILAKRDFVEQYSIIDDMEILENPALSNILGSLEEKYEKEFETYGVAHLRLPDEE